MLPADFPIASGSFARQMTLRGERIAEKFQTIVLKYVKTRYGKNTTDA